MVVVDRINLFLHDGSPVWIEMSLLDGEVVRGVL